MESFKNHSVYFLLVCIIASAILVYFIINPFLSPLIIAAVFAFLFHPVYERFLKSLKKESISAAVTTLLAIIIILLPVSFIATQIVKESADVYHYLLSNGTNGIVSSVENLVPASQSLNIDFKQYAKQGIEILLQNIGSIFSSVTKMILNLFVFLMAFFFLLKDGKKLKDYFIEVSPLSDRDDQKIVDKLKMAVSAIVKGSLMIGLIQGFLTGIGFAVFGVPNAVFWGTVAAISALIPGVGTALVLVPAIAYLFIVGNMFGGVGLLIWGMVAVGFIDNLLSPKLVGKGMKLHPLLVFLSVLGGLAFFGPLGFLLGPLTVGICLALVDIYFSLKTQK